MSLKDKMQSDVNNVILNPDDVAESVTYTDASGVETMMNAVVSREVINVEAGEEGSWVENWINAFVSHTDLTAPEAGASLTVADLAGTGTEVYQVDTWDHVRGGVVLRCRLITEWEVAGDGSRKRR